MPVFFQRRPVNRLLASACVIAIPLHNVNADIHPRFVNNKLQVEEILRKRHIQR